jgi:Astacin (Peptidase family M12A)
LTFFVVDQENNNLQRPLSSGAILENTVGGGRMRFVHSFIAVSLISTVAWAQEAEKTLELGGTDFSFRVFKTPEGTDFGYFAQNSRWPSSSDGTTIVYVCWENYNKELMREQKIVQDAITSTWQSHSKLQFRGWQQCADRSSGIRIKVSEEGPHTKGLGRDLDGIPEGMVLNFSFNRWSESCQQSAAEKDFCIRSIAVHEFGHAIGFVHEQNRPDKPGECREPAQGQSSKAAMLTPYDPHSVMNYCNEKYNNDGMLSILDVVALHKIYGAN